MLIMQVPMSGVTIRVYCSDTNKNSTEFCVFILGYVVINYFGKSQSAIAVAICLKVLVMSCLGKNFAVKFWTDI